MVQIRKSPLLSLAAAAVFSGITYLSAASDEPALCSDTLYLVEQSESQFAAIQEETRNDSGDYDATFLLPGATHCGILEDAEKRSYRCVWKYARGDEAAHKTFQHFVTEMRTCIGNKAEEVTDQSVNHPDFYASHYYRLPGTTVSVNLKNKSTPMSTLVSIRIDGFTQAK